MELIIQGCIILIAVLLSLIFRNSTRISVVLGIALILMYGVQAWFHFRREKKLSELIHYLTKVQDQLQLPNLSEMQEGRIGILQSEIYKVVALLREEYAGENAKKRYMADMLSNISHQIKTPIAAISLMTDLLSGPDVSEEKRMEYVGNIERQVNRITWLIKNLLALSQLEANVLGLKREEVLLGDMLTSLENTFSIMADVKGISLVTNHHNLQDETILCDLHWTLEALSNIVKNCIEHTPEGGRVSVKVTQDNFATTFIIKDTGEGIEEEQLPYIFDRFYRASNASKDSVGIGLSLAKQIVMKQNGVISAKSKMGEGTEFTVKIYRM